MNPEDRKDLVNFRLNRAKETLQDAEFELENHKLNMAVNRLYYACFYAVSALLLQSEIFAKTHTGIRQMFNLHFLRNGTISEKHSRFYTDIFEMRHSGDYDDYIVFEESQVKVLLEPARELIARIEEIILSNA